MSYSNDNNGYNRFPGTNNSFSDDASENTNQQHHEHCDNNMFVNGPHRLQHQEPQHFEDDQHLGDNHHLNDPFLCPSSNDPNHDRRVPSYDSTHPFDDVSQDVADMFSDDYNRYIDALIGENPPDFGGNQAVDDQLENNLHQVLSDIDHRGYGPLEENIAEGEELCVDGFNENINSDAIMEFQVASVDPSIPADVEDLEFVLTKDEVNQLFNENPFLNNLNLSNIGGHGPELPSESEQQHPPPGANTEADTENTVINQNQHQQMEIDNSNDSNQLVTREDTESGTTAASEMPSSSKTKTQGRPEIYKTEEEKKAAKNNNSKRYEINKKLRRQALENEVVSLEKENQSMREDYANLMMRYRELLNNNCLSPEIRKQVEEAFLKFN